MQQAHVVVFNTFHSMEHGSSRPIFMKSKKNQSVVLERRLQLLYFST